MASEDARAAVIAALVPGVIRMPSGVFAVMRAQEAGCQFVRST
jgi:intracellular sulfur oxidation DsrE/DsrF family protein